jgi:hypothetical protein
VEDIDLWVDFVAGNSNKLQKLSLEGKNQLSLQWVHTWANSTGYTSAHSNYTLYLNSIKPVAMHAPSEHPFFPSFRWILLIKSWKWSEFWGF